MESGSSGAASLVRPRMVVAVVAAAATVTLGVGLYLTHGRHALPEFLGGGSTERAGSTARGRLHRQNAVRRPTRRRRANGRGASGRQGGHNNDDHNHNHNHDDDETDTDSDAAIGPRQYSQFELDEHGGLLGGGPIGADRYNDDDNDDHEVTLDEFWMDDPFVPPAPTRDGQNIIGLLFRVSEDNARRTAYVHRGCACNACGVVPIRGIRYRCANCADFDLCETCELQGLHNKTHVFYKVRVPAPPFGTRQTAQPVWYAGDPDLYQQQVPRSLLGRLLRETGFERQELEAYWEQWTYMANTEWREDPDELGLAMDRKTFERCLVPSGGGRRHGAANLIHDRMFAFYDTNGDGLIGFREYLHGLTYRKRKDKLRRIFDGYDTDGDGLVSRRDFLRFFRAYYVLYKQMHRDILDGYDDALNSLETHRHTTGRQPLSSTFGRDTAVPPADLQRMMPGKAIFGDTAEVGVVNPEAGVRQPDGTDTATRQDLLARLFMNPNRRAPLSGRTLGGGAGDPGFSTETAEQRYVEALVDPPMTVDDLPGLLVGNGQGDALMTEERFAMYLAGRERRLNDELMVDWRAGPEDKVEEEDRDEKAARDEDEGEDHAGDGNGHSGSSVPPPRWAGVPLDSSLRQSAVAAAVAASQDQHYGTASSTRPLRLTRGQISAQNAAYVDRRLAEEAQVAARGRLLERWQQRAFYEDGGDGDDGEVGELGDDAGHEVMYQVMQQAFNELLDILFLEKEALAAAAAETKTQRARWRHVFAEVNGDFKGDSDHKGEDTKRPLSFSLEMVPAERDPTLPQFRDDGKTDDKDDDNGTTLPADVPWDTLREWHRIDQAEAEARADGGWGRLRFDEFERICQREELNSNRLDYLGSWIDFCIP